MAASSPVFRRLAIGYLFAQAIGATLWWAFLLYSPSARRYFMASGAPDSTLLAFLPGDITLFIGMSAASAYGLRAGRAWAWPLLVAHAGAAAYGGLYCWSLAAMSGGDGALGALIMAPSLFVPAALAWALRPPTGAS